MVARGYMVAWGCAWLLGSMHGCWGACVVAGGCAWLLRGMCGSWGVCMVAGGHAWLQGACVVAGGVPGCRGEGDSPSPSPPLLVTSG